MVGNIFYEHGHRMVATFVGLLTIVLAVWLWRREPRRWVRRLGLAALAAVILQGLLGGLTVLFLLPRPVSIAHAALAQVFFCLTVTVALVTGPRWQRDEPRVMEAGQPPLRYLAEMATLGLFVQLLLGASYRHSLLSIVPHVVGAAAVVYFAARAFARVRRLPQRPAELWRPAAALAGLVGAQLLLGPLAYWARLLALESPQPTFFLVVTTVAHVAVGGLALASSVVLTLQSHRRLESPAQAGRISRAAEKAAA
jgi:cytochrome c oxidase assembly protein subunit 15